MARPIRPEVLTSARTMEDVYTQMCVLPGANGQCPGSTPPTTPRPEGAAASVTGYLTGSDGRSFNLGKLYENITVSNGNGGTTTTTALNYLTSQLGYVEGDGRRVYDAWVATPAEGRDAYVTSLSVGDRRQFEVFKTLQLITYFRTTYTASDLSAGGNRDSNPDVLTAEEIQNWADERITGSDPDLSQEDHDARYFELGRGAVSRMHALLGLATYLQTEPPPAPPADRPAVAPVDVTPAPAPENVQAPAPESITERATGFVQQHQNWFIGAGTLLAAGLTVFFVRRAFRARGAERDAARADLKTAKDNFSTTAAEVAALRGQVAEAERLRNEAEGTRSNLAGRVASARGALEPVRGVERAPLETRLEELREELKQRNLELDAVTAEAARGGSNPLENAPQLQEAETRLTVKEAELATELSVVKEIEARDPNSPQLDTHERAAEALAREVHELKNAFNVLARGAARGRAGSALVSRAEALRQARGPLRIQISNIEARIQGVQAQISGRNAFDYLEGNQPAGMPPLLPVAPTP